MYAFRIRGYHSLWRYFPIAYSIHTFCNFTQNNFEDFVLLPLHVLLHSGLGFFLIARRYTGNNNCSLFLWVLRCFTSPGLLRALRHRFLGMTQEGFPHSEISGSKVDWHLPETYRSQSTSFVAM